MKTSVVRAHFVMNPAGIWTLDNADIYIGRRDAWGRWPASDWHNPYRFPRDGTREQCIEKYRDEILHKRPDLLARLPELRGKVLACWCTPAACHGSVLVELADAS